MHKSAHLSYLSSIWSHNIVVSIKITLLTTDNGHYVFTRSIDKNDDEVIMAPPHVSGPLLPLSRQFIPAIGLGVYQAGPGQETFTAVTSALQSGYRHVDTAAAYKNEADVGRAIRESGIPREEIFVTTKILRDCWGYDAAIAGVKRGLENLGFDYVDLMLLHAPGDADTRADTWRALEDCVDKGMIRNIGISNFGIAHIEKLLQTARIPPAVNQIELHPWLQRRDLVQYCRRNHIVVEAYSPLAKARQLHHEVVKEIAHRLGRTPAQVLIAWSLSKGFVVIPKSVDPQRQLSNLQATEISLSNDDVAALDALEEGLVTGWDPITQHEV